MMAVNKIVVAVLTMFPILSFAAEPPNLHFLKQQLIHYHDSGQYARDQEQVISEAKLCLKKHIDSDDASKKPALVLDIDETALSLYEFKYKLDFGWNQEVFRNAIKKADLKAISPTLSLYNFAKKHGVAVFFISGRDEKLRKPTIKNLEEAGYKKWDGLYLAENKKYSNTKKLGPFKDRTRKLLRSQGYDIVGNIGDQDSDLVGDDSQCKFKLPNPFYYVQ